MRITQRIVGLLVVLVMLVTIPGGNLYALSKEQRNLMNSGVHYFDIDVTSATNCGVNQSLSSLTGSNNAEKIFNYFVGRGLTPYQAAGFMGNMQAESGLDPRALQPGTTGDAPISGRGYGLVQWTFPVRQQPLIDRAKQAGVGASDLRLQLDYIWYEITDGPAPYGGQLQAIKATTDVAAATLFIEQKYEIHAGPVQPGRVAAAKGFLNKYGSGTVATTASNVGTVACPDNNSVAGGYSLPVSKKWYDTGRRASPDWFTKPHHDYPSADIPVPEGTKIFSVTAGVVTRAPMATGDTGYGQGVEIKAPDGTIYIYAHGSDGGLIAGAREGDTVVAGQLLMHSANTGQSRGAHLHFEMRRGGTTKVCPQTLLVAIGDNKPIPSITSLPASGCSY